VPDLLVRHGDLADCKLVDGEPRHESVGEGEAQLLVERLALTTNNITYAVYGERLGYWKLFPAPEGWGRIPAWGYARVVGSGTAELPEGARFFGMVPIGSHLTVRPAPQPFGFADVSPHRADLSPVYNAYRTVEGDGEDADLVMRPLFGTAVVLDLALTERGLDGVGTVVLTSGSSKTAYGLAHLLRGRPVETVALTSPSRREWVEGLGIYDEVLTYDDVSELRASGGVVLIDFAGDQALVHAVHEQLGDALARSILVGFTHSRRESGVTPRPGPEHEFFFAPYEIARRGRDFAQRYAEAWPDFALVRERALRIERITDAEQLLRVYRELLAGTADPSAGYVVSL
jgi:hypothetical protein